MNATEELRHLLEERGVEWSDSSNESVLHTTWNDMNCWFNEFPDGWTAWGMFMRGAPQQAIDATLGRGTCRFVWSLADNGWADHTCSACGYVENTDVHVRLGWHYCPNCGRRVVDE